MGVSADQTRGTARVLVVAQAGQEEPWISDLHASLDSGSVVRRLRVDAPLDAQFSGIDAVVDLGGHGTRAMVDAAAAAGVRLWQVLGTGLDDLDVAHVRASGLVLANTPGPFSAIALAEHALLLMLCVAKQLPACERAMRAEGPPPINDELCGSVLGLVGLGASGRELARRAECLGMEVHAVEPASLPAEELASLGVASVRGPEGLRDMLGASDYVSLHVPLTDRTRGMMGAPEIAAMKPSAALINVARGGLIDEAALAEALRARRLRAAGLDVFEHEPPGPDHPLLRLENVIATPHVAGLTSATSRRRARACAKNVERLLDGRPLLHEVRS